MKARRCVAWPARAVRSSLGFNQIVLSIAHWRVRAIDWGRGEYPRKFVLLPFDV